MAKGFIFDVDGTILDSMIIWMDAGKRYLGKLGIEIDYDLGRMMFEMTMVQGAEYIKKRHHLSESIEEIYRGSKSVWFLTSIKMKRCQKKMYLILSNMPIKEEFQ